MKKITILTFLFFCSFMIFLPFSGVGQEEKTEKPSIFQSYRTLNKIFNSKNLEIIIATVGCFSAGISQITIHNHDSVIILRYISTDSSLDTTKLISHKNLRQLKRIFKKGLRINPGGCTTRRTFVAKANDETISFINSRCSGRLNLTKQFMAVIDVIK